MGLRRTVYRHHGLSAPEPLCLTLYGGAKMTNVSSNRSVSFRKKDEIREGIIREDGLSGVHGSPEADVNKEWSEAGIGNAFIFGKVMSSNPDLFLELLQVSLPEMHIRSINDVRKEVDIKLSIDAHGVRLDVSARDDHGRTFDVEMQLQDEHNIAKRMRYYTGAIDQTLLEAGIGYSELSDTVVVFITPFDPFGEKRLRYTFQTLCLENNQLPLKDGVTRVVLNASGSRGEVSEELKGFLNLVRGSTSFPAGSFADRVQSQVIIARQNAEWRREYMDWKMTLLNERIKGREEGREEGLAEGLEKGREEGLAEGVEIGLAEGMETGMARGSLMIQIKTIIKKVQKGLDLPEIAEAMEMDTDSIRPVWQAVKAAAPEYDQEKILEDLMAR